MAIVDDFLGEVLGFIRTRDVENLRLRLRVEPPLPDIYTQLAKELKARYNNDELLEKHVTKLLPESDTTNPNEGDVWPGFQGFTKEYLIFWRDMDVEDLLEIHGQLTTLVKYVLYLLNGQRLICAKAHVSQPYRTLPMAYWSSRPLYNNLPHSPSWPCILTGSLNLQQSCGRQWIKANRLRH